MNQVIKFSLGNLFLFFRDSLSYRYSDYNSNRIDGTIPAQGANILTTSIRSI